MNSAHLNQAGIRSPAFNFMFARRLHAGQGLWVDTKRRRSVLALHRAASKMGHAVASQAQGAPNSNQSIPIQDASPLHSDIHSKNLGNPQSSHFVPETTKAHHETKTRFFGANTKVLTLNMQCSAVFSPYFGDCSFVTWELAAPVTTISDKLLNLCHM